MDIKIEKKENQKSQRIPEIHQLVYSSKTEIFSI